ncbi:hypothetical protein FKM82_028421 [Ascaphus truei]
MACLTVIQRRCVIHRYYSGSRPRSGCTVYNCNRKVLYNIQILLRILPQRWLHRV